MALTDICNYLQLSDQIATSGQPTAEQFVQIRAAGYEIVVNMAMPASKTWMPEESQLVVAQGMTYQHIPVVWENPTADNLITLFETLDRNTYRQVWVHCALNMRVSAMMYLYHRLQLGMDEAQAQSYLSQIWQPNEVWQHFIEQRLQEN
jgi:protein tyrosine phosphatase (PTP) superfamily phosphohydrolase (DUF442 family)